MSFILSIADFLSLIAIYNGIFAYEAVVNSSTVHASPKNDISSIKILISSFFITYKPLIT